ncbi:MULTISPECIES: acyl-ACP--UDP-N-acetylglucosamine O-acyltransferase [Niastella]|uniref:Acyl-ACP--UDP-N-acetylglucosamine O-acyltransferase n=1 Tax=Niastella soli TaxID=2821487 RepID=A0ABS3Z153_9BACT|nr:acyl-ACP--UDP-N-acetylglucosamine O-acyltransferase [Niastella soli]MBO9203882.1 acyl-ACP--UDP-N-acetylglucosamine O-acyltransferase [Niastella soli]
MIHPYTYIKDGAKVAQNVKIDPYSTIYENVEIGGGTWIGSSVTIMPGVKIGANCRIFPGVVIASFPHEEQGTAENTYVEIGNNTIIREYVTIDRAHQSPVKTTIGNNCMINAYSCIGAGCTIGNNAVIINCTQLNESVTIDDWGWVAGMCHVDDHVHIGRHSFVAGGSTVDKDVPPFVKAAHTPLRYAGINSTGLKRRGFPLTSINHILDIYRNIFNSGLSLNEALLRIEESLPISEERDEIMSFIQTSRKGIIGRNG